jgi:hypothetical protein
MPGEEDGNGDRRMARARKFVPMLADAGTQVRFERGVYFRGWEVNKVVSACIVAALVELNACSLINPHVRAEFKPDAVEESVTLSSALAYTRAQIDSYQAGIDDQAELNSALALGLIPLTAAAMGVGATGGPATTVLALGLSGAAAYGLGSWFASKPEQLLYAAGIKALICARRVVDPIAIPEVTGGALHRYLHGSSMTDQASVVAMITGARVEEALQKAEPSVRSGIASHLESKIQEHYSNYVAMPRSELSRVLRSELSWPQPPSWTAWVGTAADEAASVFKRYASDPDNAIPSLEQALADAQGKLASYREVPSPVSATVADADSSIAAAQLIYEQGVQLEISSSRLGNALRNTVDEIVNTVDAAITRASPDISTLPTAVGNLSSWSKAFEGPAISLPIRSAETGKPATLGEKFPDGRNPKPALVDALLKLRLSADRVSSIVKAVGTVNRDTLQDCGVVDTATAGVDLKVTPSDPTISFDLNKDDVRTFVVSGGKPPYGATLNTTIAPGVTVKMPSPGGSTVQLQFTAKDVVTKNANADANTKYSLLIQDYGGKVIEIKITFHQ